MSKITALDPAQAQGKTAELLGNVQKMLGSVPNMFRVASNSPSVLESLVAQFGASVHGKLGAKARAAIALSVAEVNGCDYCLSAHTALGNLAGLSPEDQRKARDGSSTDPKLAAVVALSQAITVQRGRISPAELAAARAAGVTDTDLLEVLANVALNVFTNYLNIVVETEIDFPVVHATSRRATDTHAPVQA